MFVVNEMCIFDNELSTLRWNPYNRKHYEPLGYTFTKFGDYFNVKVIDIMKGSDKEIHVICPSCGKKYNTQVRKLWKRDNSTPNTFCSGGCVKSYLIKDKCCSICGKKNTIFRHIEGVPYCEKCNNQIRRCGKTYKSMCDKNDIVILSDYAEIILRDSFGKEVARTKIDIEDVEKIKHIKWRYYNGYAYGIYNGNANIKLHRYVLNPSSDNDIDHVYRDKLDNRKLYLKEVTHKENCNNRDIIDNMVIRMSGVKRYAIEDGCGIRTSLYSCMCNHKCNNCHNKVTWEYKNGYNSTIKDLYAYVNESSFNVTFSGGDPFIQWEGFYHLARMIKDRTTKTIWAYSGYTYEEILEDKCMRLLLEQCDVLVDGKFIDELKDISLAFRGSSNQRIIDVKKSLTKGEVVLYDSTNL